MEVRVKEKDRETKLLRVAHIFFIPTDFIVCISRNIRTLMSVLIIYILMLFRIYIKKLKYTLYIPCSF